MTLATKFNKLATDNAPGQEVRQKNTDIATIMIGDKIDGRLVDFSHGDVDAHTPTPGSFEAYATGVESGGRQAYTEYRGDLGIREKLAPHLAAFTGTPVDGKEGMIITPGTQGALFLAIASTVAGGDKVAIVQPDYFANRKLVEFFEGEIVPVTMEYETAQNGAGLNLDALEAAFNYGARVFIFSNPNNPVGCVYSREEIESIAALAAKYDAIVIADQLYSRLLYSDVDYAHLRAQAIDAENVITIMGPSKTESLSGYRLGVAFGSKSIIARMEKLQAIVSLRAAGYSQAVLTTWFNEPAGWMQNRIKEHQAIRDDLVKTFQEAKGFSVRPSEAGSYLFPALPKLIVSYGDFVRILRIQANVIVTPGTEFAPHTGNSIRLNFSQDHTAAVAAAGRIVALAERYRA